MRKNRSRSDFLLRIVACGVSRLDHGISIVFMDYLACRKSAFPADHLSSISMHFLSKSAYLLLYRFGFKSSFHSVVKFLV